MYVISQTSEIISNLVLAPVFARELVRISDLAR